MPDVRRVHAGEASRIDGECLWRKDGHGLPVEYGATPIRKDGEIVGAVISFTDITEPSGIRRGSSPPGRPPRRPRAKSTSSPT